MSGFEVDPVELFAAQARVAEASVEGRESVSQVRLQGEDVLGHGWSGQAASAFRSGFEEWLTGAERMIDGLAELAAALGAAAYDYEQAETTTNGTFTRLAS